MADDEIGSSTSWRDSKAAKGMRKGGRGVAAAGQDMIASARDDAAASIHPVQYHRGGKVRKTGVARLKKGERVIPVSKVKKVDRMMKKRGMRKTGGR
jgi:hypothetical protein